MDRGYFGPTDRKNGYMGMFDNGFPPVAAAVANASLDMAAPHSPDVKSPMGVFECARRSWSSVMVLPYVYGNFAWTGMDYKVRPRDYFNYFAFRSAVSCSPKKPPPKKLPARTESNVAGSGPCSATVSKVVNTVASWSWSAELPAVYAVFLCSFFFFFFFLLFPP